MGRSGTSLIATLNSAVRLPELGPARLDRELQKYIWNGKSHIYLKDLWDYLNRYTYLPRLQNQKVLVKAVLAAISGIVPGPFAYAESWNETTQVYHGVAIAKAGNVPVVIDSDSVIIKPDIALSKLVVPKPDTTSSTGNPVNGQTSGCGSAGPTAGQGVSSATDPEKLPTRFIGTVMISSERPAREIHQIVEAIVEQLTTMPGSDVSLKLEIDAEIPGGMDRAKVRILMENATTLGFIDKVVT